MMFKMPHGRCKVARCPQCLAIVAAVPEGDRSSRAEFVRLIGLGFEVAYVDDAEVRARWGECPHLKVPETA
jgi:hypothetical protein